MNLLAKIQNKLKGEPETKTTGSAQQNIEQLDKLPDSEKLKVLDYLNSLKNLHTHEQPS